MFRRQGSATGIRREYETLQDLGRYLCIYRASLIIGFSASGHWPRV